MSYPFLVENGVVVKQIKSAAVPNGWVPSDVKVALGSGWDGSTLTPPPAPPPPTLTEERAAMKATPRQIRLALLGAGMLDAVNATVAADPAAQITWEWANVIERTDPLIAALGAGFTNPNTGEIITPEEIDDLFRAAMAL